MRPRCALYSDIVVDTIKIDREKRKTKGSASAARLELLEFHWWTASEGYQIEKSPRGQAGPHLPGTDIIKARGLLQFYTPDAADPIHRKFAEQANGPEGLVQFAESYGLPITFAGGESLEQIFELCSRMSKVIAAIDGVVTAYGDEQHAKAQACKVWAEQGQPRLTMELARSLTKGGKEAIVLKARPTSLFDYMLMLAAFELEETAAWRPCSQCGALMPLGPKGSRRRRDTCSDACRSAKSYYKRKGVAHATQG